MPALCSKAAGRSMTTPQRNVNRCGKNEPKHLEADGYLVKALRRLWEV